jgi:2,5-diketo-D-gluconate reductase B
MSLELPMGLGTSGATGAECTDSVRRALELGYRHVDTAQMYDNERAVGEGIRQADVDREEVVLASKVHPDNLAPEDVVETTHESLEGLGVDRIDLLYVHWPIRTYDAEETLPAFDRLRDDGLIAHVGVSNFTPDLLVEAIETLDAPVVANQVECHPMLQQRELRAACTDHDVELVGYSPLAQGDVLDVEELQSIAAARDATPAQVSLAWALARDVVPIPKATGDHVRENWAALELEFSDEELERIDGLDGGDRRVDPEPAPWA